jgi:hypothetical protein
LRTTTIRNGGVVEERINACIGKVQQELNRTMPE